MFESLSDAAVIEGMWSAASEENAACGQRLMWMGELYARRAPEDQDDRLNWAIDGHANVVAEISAALNIGRGRAAGQLRYAIALREQLPKVAELFATGAIDFRMMAELVNRSDNVIDPDLLAKLDAAFAKWEPTWMKMSGPKLTEHIDMWVEKFDPTGVREPRPVRDDRYVDVGPSARAWRGYGPRFRWSMAPHSTPASMRSPPRYAPMTPARNGNAAPTRWSRWRLGRPDWNVAAAQIARPRPPSRRWPGWRSR